MSQPITLARPYARAAFEMASAQRNRDDWAGKLAFAAAVAIDPRAAALFNDPRVSEIALADLVLPPNESEDSQFAIFVRLLAENHRLSVLPEIHALYAQLKAEAERVLKVTIRSPAPIDASETARLRDALKRRFDRDIEIQHAIEPGLLGGAVIDAGDVVIDGSLRGRLERMQQALAE